MNKYELLKQIHENDKYMDDMIVMSYNSHGALTNDIKISIHHENGKTILSIVGKD